jgi:hypothetical protein
MLVATTNIPPTMATLQHCNGNWKKQPRPWSGAAKAFHDDLHAYNAQNDRQSLVKGMDASQNMIAALPKNTCIPDSSPNCEDPLFTAVATIMF